MEQKRHKVISIWILIITLSSCCDYKQDITPDIGEKLSKFDVRPAENKIIKFKKIPPGPKDVLDALLSSADVSLSASSSCSGSGTEADDRTIGRYLSGFLVELSDPTAENAIVATADLQKRKQGTVWFSTVMIQHAADEDVWRWGVAFEAEQNDGVINLDSFRCLGAG